jgi:uncharacterized protein with NAD-binding domain and iron-sulfur cluster
MAESIRTKKIIIIGAGIAAGAAFQILTHNSTEELDIMIVEAGEYIGGRISSRQI